MSLFHDAFPITRTLDWATMLAAMLHAGLILLAVALRKRAPWIGFGILWFYVCHALESTIVALELVFEHRNYLALLGPAIVIVVLLVKVLHAAEARRFAPLVFTALGLLLAFNTHARALVWSNLELMLLSEYEQRPSSSRVLAGLVTLKSAQRESDQAIRYLHELQASVAQTEPAPFLSEIESQCHLSAVDPELFQKARQRLQSGIVSAFAATSLRSLSNRALTDQCPALSSDQLGLLLRTAAANGRFGPNVSCHVFDMNTRFDIEQRQHAVALGHLRQAMNACGGDGAYYYKQLIKTVLLFAADRGHLSWTLDLLSEAAKTPDKRDITDYFPDWIGAEMIRPDKIAQLRAEGQ